MFTYTLHNPMFNDTRKVSRQYVIDCMKCDWFNKKYLIIKELQLRKGLTFNKLP